MRTPSYNVPANHFVPTLKGDISDTGAISSHVNHPLATDELVRYISARPNVVGINEATFRELVLCHRAANTSPLELTVREVARDEPCGVEERSLEGAMPEGAVVKGGTHNQDVAEVACLKSTLAKSNMNETHARQVSPVELCLDYWFDELDQETFSELPCRLYLC